jgi:hypothetical protein
MEMNMKNLTPKDAPAPEPELSPARHRLADLQRQSATIHAAVRVESDNANRLNAVFKAVAPAEAALAEFDAEHAAAMSRWARGNVTGRPTTASAQRETLVRALADAELASDAARSAQTGFQAAAERASAPLPRLKIKIREAAKLVAIEEATALLPEIKAATATAESLRHRLDDARAEVMTGFEFGSNDYAEAGAALAAFDEARSIAEARPATTADSTSWRRFTAALQQDAAIDFDGAQAIAVPPTPFIPTAADPATAAMLAIASFPSQGVVR